MENRDFTWQSAAIPPPSLPGKWSKDVIAVTNFGNVFKIANCGGAWQRLAAFDKHEKVVVWTEIPEILPV